MQDKNKQAIFLGLLAVIIVSTVGLQFVGSNAQAIDYVNFYRCAKDGSFINSTTGCAAYPPLFIWLVKLFVTRELFYQQLLIVLFAFILPLVLFKITEKPIAVWFYFSTTTFFYVLLTASFFAQAFAFILILSMVFVKDWQRIILLLLSIITHSTSFYISLGFYLLLLLEENAKITDNILMACVPTVTKIIGTIGEQKIKFLQASGESITPNTIVTVFLKRIPLHFFVLSVKELWDRKKIALLGLMILLCIAGIFYDNRAFHFAGLILVCGVTWFYEKQTKLVKILLLILSLIQFLIGLRELGFVCT
jgi:hypothetical protein